LILVIKILIGICLAVIGGRIGLRRMFIISMAFVSGFVSVTFVRAFASTVTSMIEVIASHITSTIISYLVLSIPPLLIIPFYGRKLMVNLGIVEDLSVSLDAIIGAGFTISLYLALLQII
jgi:hypothetical protein